MVLPLPTAQLAPEALLALLERHILDTQPLPAQAVYGQLDDAMWFHVAGLARFWQPHEHGVMARAVEDMLTGLHGVGATVQLLLVSLSDELGVYWGVRSEHSGLLERTLRGHFPAIRLAPAAPKLGSSLRQQHMFDHGGQLTGIPQLKTAPNARQQDGQGGHQPPVQQIERLVRGMGRTPWGYYVRAMPVAPPEVLQTSRQLLAMIVQYDAQAKMTRQPREGVSIQGDRAAQACVTALERMWERVERGKAQGMWQVESTFFTPQATTVLQLAGLLRAAFAGPDSQPDPIRTRVFAAQVPAVPLADCQTPLHTGELTALMQLPTEEAPGYHVHPHARFDVALGTVQSGPDLLQIGAVLDGELTTGQQYHLPRHDLVKHGLIVGVTGSGKTNSCFGLLEQVWADGQGQPFLVIEPAKAEYRSLMQPLGNRLRVYTLGDERYAPFRLNPFEFECQDADHRIHVQTHIDYLKSVFNAAFVLYAPMPYVLERCLHEVYEDRGWNLTTSAVERRLPPNLRGREADYAAFPTLQDLYAKIDPVVDRLGYDERIQQDVKAGLKARIGSLLLGGKGLMLNTRRSIPMATLLSAPTVLELERIGDDDEKAFLMGLLLTRLYEYRVVEGRKHRRTGEAVQHLLLVEEAHRLLQNVSTAQDTEAANPRGKAVESFSNMLAEIRAYGQGVLMAEQIPSKLTPDAIKNTNLKLLHRTVAADEREVMAGTMNLDEAQTRAITTLTTGQAAVYAEGVVYPSFCKSCGACCHTG